MDIATLTVRIREEGVEETRAAIASLVPSAAAAQRAIDQSAASARTFTQTQTQVQNFGRSIAASANAWRPFQEGAALGRRAVQEVEDASLHMSHSALIGIGELTRGLTRMGTSGEAGAFAIREVAGGVTRLGAALGTVGALAGLAVLVGGGLYEAFKKAHQAQEDAVKSLKDFNEAATYGAGGKIAHDLDLVLQKVRELQTELTSRRTGITAGILGALLGSGASIEYLLSKTKEIADQSEIAKAAQANLAKEFGQTTGAAQLEIGKIIELNSVHQRLFQSTIALQGDQHALTLAEIDAQKATDDLNAKYEYQNALLKNSVGYTKDQQTALDGLAKIQYQQTLATNAQTAALKQFGEAVKQAAIDARNAQVAAIGAQSYPGVGAFNPITPGAGSPTVARIIPTIWEQQHPDVKAWLDYEQRVEQIWRRGFESIAEHGLQSFTSFFGEVLQGFRRLMDEMEKAGKDSGLGYRLLGLASAGIVGGLAGYSIGQQTGSTIGGFAGGAAAGAVAGYSIAGPYGAAVGGLVGAASGLLGAAKAQGDAAEQLRQAALAFTQSVATYAASTQGQLAQQLAAAQTQYLQLFEAQKKLDPYQRGPNYASEYASIESTYRQQVAALVFNALSDLGQQLNALNGPAGDYANKLDAINKKFAENAATERALGIAVDGTDEATQIYQKSLEQLRQSLIDVGNAAATGLLNRLNQLTGATNLAADPFADLKQAIQTALQAGDQALAQSLQQELELDQRFSKQLDAMEAAKAAAEKQAQLQADQLAVLQATQQTLSQSLSVQQQTVSNLQNVVATIRNTQDSLKLSNLTILSPREQLNEAQRQFDAALAAARTDPAQVAAATQAAQTLLQQGLSYYGPTTGYVSIYSSVQDALGSLGSQYGQQLDTQQQILAEMQAANAKLTAQIALLQQGNGIAEVAAINQQLKDAAFQPGSNGSSLVNDIVAQLTKEFPGLIVSQNGYSIPYVYYFPSTTVPQFASGGDTAGGLGLFGERGAELALTGPARVFSAAQTRNLVASAMTSSDDIVAELRQLRAEVRSVSSRIEAQTQTQKSSATRARLAGANRR